MAASSRPLALVTGASCGIGLELARELGRRGYDLVLNSEKEAELEQAASELRNGGGDVRPIKADLREPDEVERLYAEATSGGRPIEIFCANAGVGSGGGDFTETALEKDLEVVDLNVRSQVHLTKLVVRDMTARGDGKILITSSIAALMPGPFESVYAASKAFDLHFAQALRNELADKGIIVTTLQPGPTETNFFHRANMDNTPAGQGKKDDPADVARQGIDALFANRDRVISASAKTKLQGLSTNFMSDPMLASVHRKQTEPLDRSRQSNGNGAVIASVATVATLAAAGTALWQWRKQDQREKAD